MSDFWVRAVGGDDYVASVQNAAERKRLVEELKLSMKEVINTSIANDGPIYDWSAGLNRFTSALEQVLKHQMKTTKEGDKGPTADLWQYLQCLKDLLPSSSHIDVVDNLSNIKTREGKARAWFRLALNEKILADALQALINNKSSRTKWYNESALMCHAEDTMIIVNLLRGLSGVDFALSLNNDRLDHGNDSFPAASSKATQPKRKKKGGRRKRRQAVILDHNAPANIFPSSSPPSSSSSSTTKTTDINNSSEDDNYSTTLPPISTKSDSSSFVAPSFSSSTVSIRSLPDTLSTSSFVSPSSSAMQTQRQPLIEQTIPENGNTAREDKTSATNAKSTNNSLPSGAEKMIEPKEQQEEETKEDEEKLKKEREIRALQEQLRMIEQKLSSAKAIQTITTRSPTQAKEDPTLQNDESSSSTSEAAATSPSPTSTKFASSDITPSIVSQQQKITETENEREQGKHHEDKEEEPEEQEKEEEEEQETEELESNKADTNGQVNTMSNAAASALASVTNVEYVGRTMSALIQNLQSLRQAPFAGTSSLSWRKKEEEKEVGVDDKQNKEEEETEEVEPWIVLDKDTMPSSEQNDQQNSALPQEEANAKQETTDDVSSVEEEKHSKEDDIAEEKEGQNVDDDTPIEDKGTSQEDAKAAYVPPETLYPFYFPFERPPHGEEKRSSEEESQQSLIEESNETTQQTPTNNPSSVPSTSLTASTTAKPTTSPSASLSALSNSTTLRSLSASNNNNATASPAGRKRGHTKSYSLPAPSVLSSAFIDSLLAANTDIEFELDSTSSSASTSSNAKTSLSASSSPPSSSPPSSFSPSGSFSPAASSPRSSSSLSSSSSSSPTSSSTSSFSSTSPDSLEMSVKEKRTKDVINVTTFVVPPDPRDLFSASLLVHLPPQRTPSSPARTRSQSSLHRTRTLSLQRAALSSASSVGSAQTGWRPPKRQLHFVIHEKQSPREQGNLCAGCGSTFPPQGYLISTTRYCEYTGLHFCYECHVKDQCIIPSRVLANWDFKRYYVSRFARLFLREIAEEPAFNISVLNPALYTMVPALQKIKVLREQLFYMKDFVLTCRDKDRLLSPLLKPARLHLIYTTEEYSLRDLYEVSQNILLSFVRTIAEHFLLHILKCELCKAKGSFCEFCKSTTPIYPFQLRTTVQCPACRTLYHRNCFRLEECPKCLRLQQRAIIPPSSSNNAASSSS
ncbi:hypothetical protein QOT17_010909 [Balamuthia mandrillaris]